jgi:two-component sensor histidine kinase
VSQPARAGRSVLRPTIRVRLGAALALALLPILILGAVQSALTFRREGLERQTALEATAARSAANARARLASAEILLQTLAPGSVGLECAQRLSQVAQRIPGYVSLARFDRLGRVACASATTPSEFNRRDADWFGDLRRGAGMRIALAQPPTPGAPPSFLAAVRATDANGGFDGALVAVIDLRTLQPSPSDRDVPAHTEVALADASGRLLTETADSAFPRVLPASVRGANRSPPAWMAEDRSGRQRMFAVAPVTIDNVSVVLSAPTQGLFSWALLDPLSTMALPILAFTLALVAVWIVAERGVLRWINYLQRIAGIYARGRFNVHPLQAAVAPPEFHDLAEALDEMAETIAARDASLRESLAQKDAMMREIHHRVKNNMQVVSSLLNMQQRALRDSSARAAIHDTRQRIMALSLIYKHLYQGPDMREVDLRDFLEELLAQLVSGDTPTGPPIETELIAVSLILDADRLAPLSLFAVEAITNARKHGLGEGGRLRVCFEVDGAMARLMIADSGCGEGTPHVGQGVGRTLMTAFARQLRGEVRFAPNDLGGLTTELSFPVESGAASTAAPLPANDRNSATAQAF